MPHVTFAPLSGFRVREQSLLTLGMSLPGLHDRAKAIAELPALGVLNLAGLTTGPWTCSYLSVAQGNAVVIDEILADSPDLVVLSALTASIEEAYVVSRRLRQQGVTVIMGGLHVTACPDEAMLHCDAVITGRGEFVWAQVLKDFLNQRLQPRYDGHRSRAPLWPTPRFDLLKTQPARFILQTQTGCPFSCDFCGASRMLGKFHEKPIQNIRQELQLIKDLSVGRPVIELADDNTFAGSRDVNLLFDAFRHVDARWFTEVDWRIGERPEILERLAEAGCVQVLVGLESLVFRYPGMGRKQAEMDRMMQAVRAIQQAGVAVNGCFIIGADGETSDSLQRLVEFILQSPLAEVQITIQTPFPGTALHQKLNAEGRLLQDRGWSAYTLFDVTYQPDAMTVQELEAGFVHVLKQVFCANASNRRMEIRKQILRRKWKQ